MNKLSKKQIKLYNNSIPLKKIKCNKCNSNMKYISKNFIDWWKKVCDRCLFHYKCETCNKVLQIYSDWEIIN